MKPEDPESSSREPIVVQVDAKKVSARFSFHDLLSNIERRAKEEASTAPPGEVADHLANIGRLVAELRNELDALDALKPKQEK